jgi:hypothetical protein
MGTYIETINSTANNPNLLCLILSSFILKPFLLMNEFYGGKGGLSRITHWKKGEINGLIPHNLGQGAGPNLTFLNGF